LRKYRVVATLERAGSRLEMAARLPEPVIDYVRLNIVGRRGPRCCCAGRRAGPAIPPRANRLAGGRCLLDWQCQVAVSSRYRALRSRGQMFRSERARARKSA
jgi:hypothetical protein